MKRNITIQLILTLLSAMLTLHSCTNENEAVMHTSKRLIMNCTFAGFNGSATRAGESEVNIADGARMYLDFDGLKTYATYDKSTNAWSIDDWSDKASGKVTAYYHRNIGTLNLDEMDTPYQGSGSFSNTQDAMTINVTLKPITARIRFHGKPGKKVEIKNGDLLYYNYFDTNSFSFLTYYPECTLTIESDGYTPYIYVVDIKSVTTRLTPADNRLILIEYDGNSYFYYLFPEALQPGKSGYIDLVSNQIQYYPEFSIEEYDEDEVLTIEQYEAVDLGLPSGTLWATCNVGASSPEEYGDYFAWGETEPKSEYSWSNYKWCNGTETTITKYCTVDNKSMLDLADDAAHVNWGSNWRTPTRDELDELRDNSIWTWTSQKGVNGYTVIGPNGNSIFLPVAGYRSDYLWNDGSVGEYWLAMFGSNSDADCFHFDSNSPYQGHGFGQSHRYYGRTVRPVRSKIIKVSSISLLESTMSLAEGGTHILLTSTSPSNATDRSVTWTSSNPFVAIVNQSGKVTAIKTGTATITATTNDGSGVKATCSVSVSANCQINMHNGHEYVDLGLPSGLKWAICNVGASSPEECGDYFAWGETEPKPEYDWSNYKWCNGTKTTITKYCTDASYGIVDNKTVLDLTDDAAHVNWGGEWRMPTPAELSELCKNCTWDYYVANGTEGYRVKSTTNSNSIFLPIAGLRIQHALSSGEGYYWSNSQYESEQFLGYHLLFELGNVCSGGGHLRCYGLSVRPVCP